MRTPVILIVVCLVTLGWVAGTSALYTYRRDWPRLRRFLFARHRGITGAPTVFWAAMALAALVRIFVV
jgi:hypothetical protein